MIDSFNFLPKKCKSNARTDKTDEELKLILDDLVENLYKLIQMPYVSNANCSISLFWANQSADNLCSKSKNILFTKLFYLFSAQNEKEIQTQVNARRFTHKKKLIFTSAFEWFYFLDFTFCSFNTRRVFFAFVFWPFEE